MDSTDIVHACDNATNPIRLRSVLFILFVVVIFPDFIYSVHRYVAVAVVVIVVVVIVIVVVGSGVIVVWLFWFGFLVPYRHVQLCFYLHVNLKGCDVQLKTIPGMVYHYKMCRVYKQVQYK